MAYNYVVYGMGYDNRPIVQTIKISEWEDRKKGPMPSDEVMDLLRSVTLTKTENAIVMRMFSGDGSIHRWPSGQWSFIGGTDLEKFIKTKSGEGLLSKGLLRKWIFFSDPNRGGFALSNNVVDALDNGFEFSVRP